MFEISFSKSHIGKNDLKRTISRCRALLAQQRVKCSKTLLQSPLTVRWTDTEDTSCTLTCGMNDTYMKWPVNCHHLLIFRCAHSTQILKLPLTSIQCRLRQLHHQITGSSKSEIHFYRYVVSYLLLQIEVDNQRRCDFTQHTGDNQRSSQAGWTTMISCCCGEYKCSMRQWWWVST